MPGGWVDVDHHGGDYAFDLIGAEGIDYPLFEGDGAGGYAGDGGEYVEWLIGEGGGVEVAFYACDDHGHVAPVPKVGGCIAEVSCLAHVGQDEVYVVVEVAEQVVVVEACLGRCTVQEWV